jgi:alkylation response protein AidB-like acyl-CoA dehydrogenase
VNATLAEADASVAMVYLMHILGATAISAARSGETQAVTPILKEIAAGRHISTLAFSEAGSRSHFWAPSRAHRNGNGVRISARKSWVTSAGQAHSYVVSALAPKGRGPPIRLSYLLPAQTRGLAVAGPWDRKNARKPGGGVRRDTFYSLEASSTELRRFFSDSCNNTARFLAAQTVWRREWESPFTR